MTRSPSLLLIVLLVACGGVSQIPPETARSLREGRVAVAFYNLDKRIAYSELVYKVLWNETRAQEAAFSGLWDVDGDLTTVVVARLHDLSIQGFEWGDAIAVDDRNAALQTLCPSVLPDQAGVSQLSVQLRRSLRAHGASHFILWCTGAQMVSVAGFNSFASLMWPGRLFLFDATSGQLLHTEWLVPQRQIEYRKSVREIEANGLAELRRISAKAVAETIRRDVSEILRAPLKVRTLKDQHPRAPSATPGMAAEAESGTQPTPKVLDAPQQHVASSVPEVDGEQSVREGEDPGPGREAEVTQDTTTTPEP